MKKTKNQKGYIALSSILVISAVVLVIGISTSLLSVNDLLSSYSGERGDEAVDFAESCIEDVLLRLNEDNSIPESLVIPAFPGGSCTIATNSHVGNDWDITVAASLNSYTRNIRLTISRDTTVTVNSWLEI